MSAEKMGDWFARHWFLIVTIVALAAVSHYRIGASSDRLDRMDTHGTAQGRETIMRMESMNARLEKVESRSDRQETLLYEMKSDLRVVAEWVQEQKNRKASQ